MSGASDRYRHTDSASPPKLRLEEFDAAIFDLDGVITRTARVHAEAWKRLFDDFLRAPSKRWTPAMERY